MYFVWEDKFLGYLFWETFGQNNFKKNHRSRYHDHKYHFQYVQREILNVRSISVRRNHEIPHEQVPASFQSDGYSSQRMETHS